MNSLILVAGGSGSRFGSTLPKQYLELEGKAVIIRTLERFYLFDPGLRVVVVISPDHRKHWEEVACFQPFPAGVELALGGANRHASVMNGLALLKGEGVVGIHDAVRPLVSLETMERTYRSARDKGSGIPVVEMDESVRQRTKDGRSLHLDRSTLCRVQTPQVFRLEEISEAYARPFNPAFTDDASVYEACFDRLELVEGNVENLKITTTRDLDLARLLL